MSAFQVMPECINKALSGLFAVGRSNEELQFLGDQIADLNARALTARYPDSPADPIPFTFKYKQTARLDALKQLECIVYQCSEGNVPESQLYRILVGQVHATYAAIVHELEEYKKYKWGE